MADDIQIKICRLRPKVDADIPLPRYMTPNAAGMDVCAAVSRPVTLLPGSVRLVPTGFAVALPPGFEAQIRPRSGLAVHHSVGLINSPGTIDADYRGEVRIAVMNWGTEPFVVHRGDRIAQMIISRVYQPRLVEVQSLEQTDRNTGGFGHTGR